MIVVVQSDGQMCNKIVYFVHALATALDCKTNLVHFFAKEVCEFADLHPEALTGINVSCHNRPSSKYINLLAYMLHRVNKNFDRPYYDANELRCKRWMSGSWKHHVLWNWYFRNNAGIVRHRDKICAYLQAKELHSKRPRAVVDKIRNRGVVVVGVHIRRGDYVNFYGGRFFFSDAEYLRFMQDFVKSINFPVTFLISSNEPVNMNYFRSHGLSVMTVAGTPQEDVLSLSMCDYIMGPHSSFSWFAAYYGNRPLLHLYGRTDKVSVSRFEQVREFRSFV